MINYCHFFDFQADSTCLHYFASNSSDRANYSSDFIYPTNSFMFNFKLKYW